MAVFILRDRYQFLKDIQHVEEICQPDSVKSRANITPVITGITLLLVKTCQHSFNDIWYRIYKIL